MKSLTVSVLSIACLMLPASSQEAETTAKRIAWKSSVLDAFVEAVESNKPLVVVFLSNPAYKNANMGNLSNRQSIELDELSVHQLAEDAVFVVARFDHRIGRVTDEYGHRVLTHLKITELPTISVIAPRTDALTEMYRMDGFFEASDIAGDLSRCFKQYAATQVLGAPHGVPKPPENNLPVSLEFNPYELQPL